MAADPLRPAPLCLRSPRCRWRRPAAIAAKVGEMVGFLSWWDGVELWLSGLGFVVQTAVVMPVVLALAYGLAVVLDAALGQGIRVLERVRHDDGGAR